MHAHHSTKAAVSHTTPALLSRLDARVQTLRAESRTGLGTKDVRRALIQEQLRPPAPHRLGTDAAAGDDVLDLPTAWLDGDLRLDSVESEAGRCATPPPLSEALDSYRAICAAAAEVHYDVAHEETLRLVEQRNTVTGAATAWRARRRLSVPLHCSPAAAAQAEVVAASPRGAAAASHAVYTPPPCLSSALPSRCGPSSRLAAALSAARPISPSSCASATPVRAWTPASSQSSLRRGGGGPAASSTSLSTVGTAVARSSGAAYAMALRRQVQQQQRQQQQQEQQLLHRGSARWAEDGAAVAAPVEWRTCVTAAVAVCVCSACHAWFDCPLQSAAEPPHQLAEGEVVCCPRCGHAASIPEPCQASSSSDCSVARVPPPEPPRAGAARPPAAVTTAAAAEHRNTATSGVDAGGGGACDAEEEEVSFATLVSRIRLARQRAERRGSLTAASTDEADLGMSVSSAAAAARVPCDSLAQRLRVALGRLYFHELLASAAEAVP
ncbi:hypothetical protein NESM_000593000 [Novymonas esmeraldas]|uniref:Uncharacterized protein n=1 Tax=Novymonas esmeraldas TaxID=1808958 RepID=A0AAW0EUT6_9TRYP